MKLLARFLAVAALAFAPALALDAHAAKPPQWTVVDLGAMGPWGSRAQAVNNRGDVVGETATPANGVHPFLWQNGLMVDIGAPPPATFGFVQGVTDRGAILVNTERGTSFVWKDGGWTELPVSSATDINKFESIVGSYSPVPGPTHAYLIEKGVLRDLGTLGGIGSRAWALNDRGTVVGASNLPNFDEHAFLYEDGAMRDLGTFGGRFSVAYDVNSHGVVVGSATFASGWVAPFIYDGGAIRMPVSLPVQSEAVAINDHGAIVGRTFDGKGWLFDAGVLTSLEQIPEVRAAGWTSLVPADINDRGWIVGQGQNASGWHAFLLMPR
jgi:probable HAF family extracellular repeat protein